MTQPSTEVTRIVWKQVFPWLLLLRTFSISLRVRQVVLGMLAAWVMTAGAWMMTDTPQELRWPWQPLKSLYGAYPDILLDLLQPGWEPFRGWAGFLMGPWTWMQTPLVLGLTAWGLVFGGWFGGLISRMAAFELLREETISWKRALRAWVRHAVDYLFAGFLPWAAILCLLLLGVGYSALCAPIPPDADLAKLLFGARLLFVVFAVLIGIGLVLGWPLMITSLSVSQTDGFDAFSRGLGMVYDRWRQLLGCLLLWWVYGLVLAFLLQTLIQLSLHLAGWLDWSSDGAAYHWPRGMILFASPGMERIPDVWYQVAAWIMHGWIYS